MITHEEIEQTLRLLSSRHEDVSSLSPLMQEAISTVRSATKQTGQSNIALADFCNENLDAIYYEIFNSPITKTPISLGYETESVSATNLILEYMGVYFFQGTDMDDLGPYQSLREAIRGCEMFELERHDGQVDLWFDDELPQEILRDIIKANHNCAELLINGRRYSPK